MRNPLTSVLACLDVLEEDVSTSGCVLPRGDKGEAISDIREGINQLSGVIEWFLGVCRGPESESLGWLDLNAAVRRAVALLQRDWGSKVEVHCRLGDLPAMRAFGRQLTQVIVNLLVNACQASDAGQIWLETSMVDSRVFVAVRDDGEGMAPEQIHRAFEAGVTSRPGKGSGLGLAISRKIIEKHGGKIWVESLMGHGTTVTVEVPANLDNVAVRKATLSP
jgi:signal transduction histidine kinase